MKPDLIDPRVAQSFSTDAELIVGDVANDVRRTEQKDKYDDDYGPNAVGNNVLAKIFHGFPPLLVTVETTHPLYFRLMPRTIALRQPSCAP